MKPFSWRSNGNLLCRLRVQPRAGREQFAGLVGDRMKVRVKSAPVDGKANEALTAFLAKSFGVPRTRVMLMTGQSARNKIVEIQTPRRLPKEIIPYVDSTGQE
ncbi:MAG: DUF167 domain-containing protein [Gammaproteobacteria bacterium]